MEYSDVVVITGATAGVGRTTARLFSKHKARLGLIARDETRLREAKEEMESLGAQSVCIVPCDVANHEEVYKAAENIETELGPISIWINNAMTTIFAPFYQISPQEFKRATEVTYLGFVYGTMAALKYMIPRNRGVIVQVGSALAYRAIPLQSAYCGAKMAIRGFTDSIRSELMHDHISIHLTMVHLPALNTPQFGWCKTKIPFQPQPVPPIFQPEVAAKAIFWAAHHKRRELFVGKSTLKAVLANKVFPGLLDKILAKRAYKGQLTDQKIDLTRPFNLFQPVPGHQSAHGMFDKRARDNSWQLWITTHRSQVAQVILILAAGLLLTSMVLFA